MDPSHQDSSKDLNSRYVSQLGTDIRKPMEIHPWQKTIKYRNMNKIMRAHNSVGNPEYPVPKASSFQNASKAQPKRIIFTVIGIQYSKEFIYCVKMLQGMHKYRWRTFGAPIVKGVTEVEWPRILSLLKSVHGNPVFCLSGPVVLLCNNKFFGGESELKNLIEERYIYHIALNYQSESIDMFKNFVNNTGRSFAYLHIAVDDEPIGCLIFMLYSDIVPNTCENFLRLCQTTKGGYSGTPVHRIVEDGWIQCGGFELKDTPLGCENFIVPHDRRGVLGMCNAERGVECSTQFFVLLQPAVWMNHKYVAFGQLIEGEETLKKIEKITTFFESPTKNIVIFKAGVLNLEIDCAMIKRGAVAYIDAHIEDLVLLGEMLYEWLMERVNLEIEFRYLENLKSQNGENESPENDRNDNLRATERFMRNKDDIHNELATASPVVQRKSSAPSHISRTEESVNEDFDVDDYQFEAYEDQSYVYSQDLSTKEVIKKKPFYIPLTDVPYPGERDSNYDLKRFLRGDYCLEDDLDKRRRRSIEGSQNVLKNKLDMDIIGSHTGLESHSRIHFSDADNDIDDEEINSIMEYIRDNEEKVSFSGKVVASIADKYIANESMRPPHSTFNDEEIRRMRVTLQQLKLSQTKKVSIHTTPWKMHAQIKRRQTGPIRPDLGEIENRETENDPVANDRHSSSLSDLHAGGLGEIPRVYSRSVTSRLLDVGAFDDDDDKPTLKEKSLKFKESEKKTFESVETMGPLLTKSQKLVTPIHSPSLSSSTNSVTFDGLVSGKRIGRETEGITGQYTNLKHPNRNPTITIDEYKKRNKAYLKKKSDMPTVNKENKENVLFKK